MGNTTLYIALLVLALANPTPAAGQDSAPFKHEIDAYLECINTQVLRQQAEAGHKIDSASAVIHACSAARSRLRVASGDASTVEKIISGVEAHLRMRERAADGPKE